ncbi:MAG: DUF2306 domain-containing protein [Saprospiraceae bacterium]|nr:DUF2306 domain-containing protein [Saprospiraceae bacterium]
MRQHNRQPLSIALGIVIFLALSITTYSARFLDGERKSFLFLKSDTLWESPSWKLAFYLHVVGGMVALSIGGFQFVRRWRDGNLRRHRRAGTVYFLAVLSSGLAGLYLALHATGGLVAQLGFTGLATAWLSTGFVAYKAARQRDIGQHERWMTRNYAVTFAAVTLRLWLPLLIGALGLTFMEAYKIVSWLCWVPNLLFAEMLIRRNNIGGAANA